MWRGVWFRFVLVLWGKAMVVLRRVSYRVGKGKVV